jgi:hypothetical protein
MNAVIEQVPCAIRRSLVVALVAAMFASSSSAWASLGQGVASVESDRSQMQGSRRIAAAQDYSIHEIQAPTGTVVREFVRADGTVFAIAWQGPFIPNLRQLLGAYFVPFAQAAQAHHQRHAGHGALLIETPDLVVEAGGHMRAFFGRAYIPYLLPHTLPPGGLQ